MEKMERVGSSAMNSLAAYADSDEEDENEDSGRRSDSGADDDEAQRFDSAYRHRTLSTAELATAQLPEAPDSYGEEEGEAGSDRSFKGGIQAGKLDDDDDGDAEFRRLPLISDEYEEVNDDRLKEPPPPARPKAFQSPSPSSSRGSTPQNPKRPRMAAMPRLPSSQALVSYSAEDEDEYHQRQSVDKADQEKKLATLAAKILDEDAVPLSNEGSGDASRPMSDRSHKSGKSEATTDDIDVDELLEKPLEVNAGQSSGVNSPGDATVFETIQIPPEPTEKCPEELQAKFRQYLERKRREGYNFNAVIQNRTDFRNPSIYEKLIEHFGIDELGTNFPKNIYDPHGFQACDYYDEIAKAQRLLMEKGADLGKDTKPKPTVAVASTSIAEEKKRKSKWDN